MANKTTPPENTTLGTGVAKSDAAPNLPTVATPVATGANPTPTRDQVDTVAGTPPSEPRPAGPNATPGMYRAEARAGKANGPTIEQYVAEGYDPALYPPKGYAEVPSEGLSRYRATGKLTADGSVPGARKTLADGSTHLVVRSRNDSFRRAGLRFTRQWTAIPVADLDDAQIEAIEKEGMLDVRHSDEQGLEEYDANRYVDENMSPAEMKQKLADANDRADAAEKQLAELRARYEGSDMPPVKGMLPDGTPIGR